MNNKKRKVCLLVAEDERATGKRLEITKRRSKYDIEFTIFEYADEIIEEFKNNKYAYDLVILDNQLNTSTMNGIDIAYKLIYELNNGLDVVILSSSNGSIPHTKKKDSIITLVGLKEVDAAKKAGCIGWVVKGKSLIKSIDFAIEFSENNKDSKNKEFFYLGDD